MSDEQQEPHEPAAESGTAVEQPAGSLTDVQVALLEFEQSWWKYPGAKETASANGSTGR